MTTQRDAEVETGLGALLQRSSLSSIWGRRTHRVSRGSSVEAGSLSWTSNEPRTPLTDLEEAVLISHHLENAYYEQYFRNGMTEAHELHDQRWHRNGNA